jgi:hypothetical protein
MDSGRLLKHANEDTIYQHKSSQKRHVLIMFLFKDRAVFYPLMVNPICGGPYCCFSFVWLHSLIIIIIIIV